MADVNTRSIVLVEGLSDRRAVETAAKRIGLDLSSHDVSVVSMGGIHAIDRFLAQHNGSTHHAHLAGLYDLGEARVVSEALRRAEYSPTESRADLERLGFFACVADLEEEIIRAMGTEHVEVVIADQAELGAFRKLQKQPEWRHQPVEAQLRRFMGSGATRKIRYASLLINAMDLDRIPAPILQVLAFATRTE